MVDIIQNIPPPTKLPKVLQAKEFSDEIAPELTIKSNDWQTSQALQTTIWPMVETGLAFGGEKLKPVKEWWMSNHPAIASAWETIADELGVPCPEILKAKGAGGNLIAAAMIIVPWIIRGVGVVKGVFSGKESSDAGKPVEFHKLDTGPLPGN